MIENAEYVQVSHELSPGDHLVLYTDGISEAMNEQNELYGLDRLCEQAASASRRGALVAADPRKCQAVRRQAAAERRHLPCLRGKEQEAMMGM